MKFRFLDIEFKNPVILASGPWWFGEEYEGKINFEKLGAITFKSLTKEERVGNPTPHILVEDYVVYNSVGLKNPGINKFISDIYEKFKNLDTVLIVSIAGHSEDEFIENFEKLSKLEKVSLLELNLSCPNVSGGLFCFNKQSIKYILENVKAISKKPIIVKFSPEGEILPYIETSLNYGADIINLANSPIGLKIDIENKKPFFYRIFCGYSGKAVKPLILKKVYETYKAFKCPIIGLGGIFSYQDALEYIFSGALFVSVGSAIYYDYKIPERIVADLQNYLKENGLKNHLELVGIASKDSF
ncbi:MAG: dihydroorotate dehydrogenase [candidate division WOR-3 bacterium]|nr:dihydroorotate dehydrogenase [candidate division WOR-3 bacterium]